MNSEQKRQDTSDKEENESVEEVQNSDFFVICGGQPRLEVRPEVFDGEGAWGTCVKDVKHTQKNEAKGEADKAEEEDKAGAEDSAEPPVLVEEEEETEPTPPAKNDEEQDGEEKAETEAPAVASAVVSPSPQRPSSQDPPPKPSNLPTKTTASAMNRATETNGDGNGGGAAKAMPCLFSSPVFAQQRDQMEFFLPAACSCPKCRAELAAAAPADEVAGTAPDPTALQTILRPWQVEFLKAEGIETARELVDVEKDADRRQSLCRHMKRWRKERDLPAKTISCLMAARIWAKTSEEALKNANTAGNGAK